MDKFLRNSPISKFYKNMLRGFGVLICAEMDVAKLISVFLQLLIVNVNDLCMAIPLQNLRKFCY
jgi:hypothetical protein